MYKGRCYISSFLFTLFNHEGSSETMDSSTTTAIPTPTTVVTEPCKQKAGYLAHYPARASILVKGATGITTIAFLLAVVLCAWVQVKNNRYALRKTYSCGSTLFATPCLSLVAFFFATYVLAIQHEFYCELNPKWQNWYHEWLVAGLVVAPFMLSALLDWLFISMNIVVGRRSTHSTKRPWSSLILWPWAVVFAALVDAIDLVANVSLKRRGLPPRQKGSALKHLFTWAKKQIKPKDIECEGIELDEEGGVIEVRHGVWVGGRYQPSRVTYGPQYGQHIETSTTHPKQATMEDTTIGKPPPIHHRN